MSSQRLPTHHHSPDRQYSYGTPSVKRHRVDDGYHDPYAFAQYTDNVSRYYNDTPSTGRTYGTPTLSYPQVQQNPTIGGLQHNIQYYNPQGSYSRQDAVQNTGTSAAQPLTHDNWSGAYQQNTSSAPAVEVVYGSNAQLTRTNYVESDYQHQTNGQYGAQPPPETFYQTPTSMIDSTSQSSTYPPLNSGQNADAEPAHPTHTPLVHQNYPGDVESWYGRVTPGSTGGQSLQATAHPTSLPEASFEQAYPTTSRYSDAKYPVIATTTTNIPHTFPYISGNASPIRSYATLGDSTLNSSYSAGGYQST